MKKLSLLALLISCLCNYNFSQFYTPAELTLIHSQKTAAEGDMYLDTLYKNYFIGLTTGELTKVGFLDSISFSNDSLQIFNGDSTFLVEINSGRIDSLKYENDTLKLFSSDSLFQVKITPEFLINGLDNSTVYLINTTNGTSTSSDTGCPNGTIRIKRMLEDVSAYGYQGQAFIGCDDNIWVCGDAGTTTDIAPFGYPNTTSDARRLFAVPENPTDDRKGKWKYIWATRGALWALTDSGEIYRKGDANSGQLGNNSSTNNLHFLTKMIFSDTISDKVVYLYPGAANNSSIYYSTVFALTKSGDVYSWGENQYRQIGLGTTSTSDQLIPFKIPALDAPVIVKLSISDMRFSSCFAIDNANNLYSWGYNNSGGLGNGSVSGNISTPTLIPGIKASEVKTVGYLPCTRIITMDSSTMATGENNDRQLGDNTNTDKTTFVDIFYNSTNDTLMNNIAEIDMWGHNSNGGSLVVTYDRELWVCGGNIDGQQGIGTPFNDEGIFQKPIAEFQGMIKKAIFVGSDNGEVSITVLDTLGRIWTCGDNIRGQASEGTLTTNTTGLFSLAIAGGKTKGNFVDIKAFGRTSVAGFAGLTEDGKVFVTGSDSQQQAGVGEYPAGNVNYLRPIVFE